MPHARHRTLAVLVACLAAAPATRPAKPAKPAKPTPPDLSASLADGTVRFQPPPAAAWTAAPNAPDDKALYLTADHRSAIQFELATFDISPSSSGQIGTALCKSLKERRQKDGNDMLLAPTIERDKRFDLVIHERYQIKGAVQEQWHLFKSVGPKTVMVAAGSTSNDTAAVNASGSDAMAALATAKYFRAGTAKPKRP